MKNLLAAITLTLMACQTYDFEPVNPLAVSQTTISKKIVALQNKPNVLFLIDKSGSMSAPVGSSGATRMSEMKSAFDGFFAQYPTLAQYGMAAFPSDATCGATASIGVELSTLDDKDSSGLTAHANQVNQAVQALMPLGGTPTADSLRFLANYQPLTGTSRVDLVFLLTDGLPNCDANNPNNVCSAPNPSCRCTQASCAGQNCAQGCLDDVRPVAAINELKAKGISTVVVGFGADTLMGDGPAVLNAMARAGGDFALRCPGGTDAECGAGNSCDAASGQCARSFFQAQNATELAELLRKIVGTAPPCDFTLSVPPADPRFLAVIIDGQNVARGPNTWDFVGTGFGAIRFFGTSCSRIQTSTPSNPVGLEIRSVEPL